MKPLAFGPERVFFQFLLHAEPSELTLWLFFFLLWLLNLDFLVLFLLFLLSKPHEPLEHASFATFCFFRFLLLFLRLRLLLVSLVHKAEILIFVFNFFIAAGNIIFLLLEQIEQGVGRSNEVRVVGVDQRGLNLDDVGHLLAARHDAFIEHALHDIVHFALQLVISVELGKLDFENQSFELFTDAFDEFKTWLE